MLLNEVLVRRFLEGGLQLFKRMWKLILEAHAANLEEPGFRRWSTRAEETHSMLMEDVVGEPTDHPKDGELAEMEVSCTWQASSKKADN